MGLTVRGIPVISDALRALAALKNGVSKETQAQSECPNWFIFFLHTLLPVLCL
jgi:hypothetical protein